MTTLADLEKRVKRLADTRATLSSIVASLNEGIYALKRQNMPQLKAAANAWAEEHDKLKALIEAHPELFTKPRTVVMHGIKLGFRKGTGSMEFDDAEQVVKLVRKHFPDEFDLLVKTEHKPVKKALEQLTAAELKRLGITVEETGDVVFIKPTDSAVDKLVNALLKSATEEADA